MKKFEELSEQDLVSAITNKTPLRVLISDEITKFEKEIPEVDFSKPVEVSPTSIIYSAKTMAEIFFYSAENQQGKYIRFVAAVYWNDGKTFYKKLGAGTYEIKVKWNDS